MHVASRHTMGVDMAIWYVTAPGVTRVGWLRLGYERYQCSYLGKIKTDRKREEASRERIGG